MWRLLRGSVLQSAGCPWPYHNPRNIPDPVISVERDCYFYPHILGKYLKKNHLNAEIHEISGSVEIARA